MSHNTTIPISSSSAPLSLIIPNSHIWQQLQSQQHNNQDLLFQLLQLNKKILEKQQQLYQTDKQQKEVYMHILHIQEQVRESQLLIRKVKEGVKVRAILEYYWSDRGGKQSKREGKLGENQRDKQSRLKRI